MKKEIPWELIISDLKQDISDADKKHLEQIVIRLRKGLKDIFLLAFQIILETDLFKVGWQNVNLLFLSIWIVYSVRNITTIVKFLCIAKTVGLI